MDELHLFEEIQSASAQGIFVILKIILNKGEAAITAEA